jgi:uncharacterized protein
VSPDSIKPGRSPDPIPARAGIGLRAPHHDSLADTLPDVGWLEAHSENYFADGGAQIEALEKLRAHYPLSLHSVGLSLGTTDELDIEHLARLRKLVKRTEPGLISDHLCWGSVGGRASNDLLPLPYTEEAMRHLASRILQVQDYLGRQILIENVSSYLEFACSEMSEWEFLAGVAQQSGCGILLDVNNIYVSACNHGFDPLCYFDGVPAGLVREYHVAGHTVVERGGAEILIDTHSAPVCDAVWELYREALRRFGPLPTLIEWDSELPEIDVLVAEAKRADTHMQSVHGLAA